MALSSIRLSISLSIHSRWPSCSTDECLPAHFHSSVPLCSVYIDSIAMSIAVNAALLCTRSCYWHNRCLRRLLLLSMLLLGCRRCCCYCQCLLLFETHSCTYRAWVERILRYGRKLHSRITTQIQLINCISRAGRKK